MLDIASKPADATESENLHLPTVAARYHDEIVARADEFDALRKLPQDLVDRLSRDGLYKLCNPAEYGGSGQTPRCYAEVVETLARADASVGWCAFIGITSAFSMASAGTAMVRALLNKPGAITAGVFAPTGTSRAATRQGEKGYLVSGRWSWGSGSQNAHWVNGGTLLIGDDGKPVLDVQGRPKHLACILDAREIIFCDTWRVMGLQGTGSTDFEVQDMFIPEERAYERTADRFGAQSDEPIFQFPNFGMLGIGVGATALGTARAAIEEVLKVASAKTPQGSTGTLIEKPSTAKDIAKAEAEVRSGRAYLFETIDAAWESALAGHVTIEVRRDLRLAITHAVTAAKSAIDLVHELAGGTSVYLQSPIQRRFRDIHVITQHMMVNQSTYELFGRLFLGLPTNTDQL